LRCSTSWGFSVLGQVLISSFRLFIGLLGKWCFRVNTDYPKSLILTFISVAAAPLAAWVSANLQYALIVEKIAPLEQKKETLERNLNAAEKQMASLSKGLKTVDKRVEGLKSNFEVYMKEATEIKIGLEREQATLVVASTLVERLGDEYTRWQQQSKQLETELATIENYCLLGVVFKLLFKDSLTK